MIEFHAHPGKAVWLVMPALLLTSPGTSGAKARADVPEESLSLDELIKLPEADLAKVDIATVNLACAEGLPGSERIDRAALRRKLDAMAWYVGYETRRHAYQFRKDPEAFSNSWGEFCMLVMASVLQEDFGTRYSEEQAKSVNDPNKFDFTRSQDLFINGLLAGTGGTCASMPVLYIAVGRRLGYPLKLVTSVEHSFLRWDDPATGERFNIEGTTRGYASYPDVEYRSMPREWNAAERDSSNYLQSLTPREELAVFLCTRGDSLCFLKRVPEAHQMYKRAVELAPDNYPARYWLERTGKALARLEAGRKAMAVEEMYQRIEKARRSRPQIVLPGMPTVPVPYASEAAVRRREVEDFVLQRQNPFPTSLGPANSWGAAGFGTAAGFGGMPGFAGPSGIRGFAGSPAVGGFEGGLNDIGSWNVHAAFAAEASLMPQSGRQWFEEQKRRTRVMRHDGSYVAPPMPGLPGLRPSFPQPGIQRFGGPASQLGVPSVRQPMRVYPHRVAPVPLTRPRWIPGPNGARPIRR